MHLGRLSFSTSRGRRQVFSSNQKVLSKVLEFGPHVCLSRESALPRRERRPSPQLQIDPLRPDFGFPDKHRKNEVATWKDKAAGRLRSLRNREEVLDWLRDSARKRRRGSDFEHATASKQGLAKASDTATCDGISYCSAL